MINRKKTRQIRVGNVLIGGGAPVSVQSMTTSITKDVDATVREILRLEDAGVDIIRFAVNDLDDAAAIPEIKKRIHVPTIADVQYDYRLAVAAAENGIDGLRINPGNIGERWKVEEVVKACKAKGISIRVGVNSGSVKKEFLEKYNGVNADSICYSALEEIEILESMGFRDIKVSLKASDVNLSIDTYTRFSEMSDYPLHLGITEAGPKFKGTVKSAVGIGTLLANGIGDTIRVSLTTDTVEEVRVGREILRSLGLDKSGIDIVSCPTCARTKINLYDLVEEAEERLKGVDKDIKVALMGCPVNGPGEAKEADIGIAGGVGQGVIFKKGEIIKRVKEEELLDELFKEIEKL